MENSLLLQEGDDSLSNNAILASIQVEPDLEKKERSSSQIIMNPKRNNFTTDKKKQPVAAIPLSTEQKPKRVTSTYRALAG